MILQWSGAARFFGVGLVGCALIGQAVAADIAATADTYTQSDAATTNYGASGITAVAVNRTTLIQFDPATIAQSSGASATLKIKVGLAKNSMDGVSVRVITSPWSEKTVTAKTMPSISTNVLDTKTITPANQGQFVTFDVSGALAAWRSSPAANFGLALVPATPTPNLQLGSRESGDGAVLTLAGAVPKNSVTVAVTGGDYPDPQTAVDNAFHGDKWCVSPVPPTKRCTINVKEGIYPSSFPLALPAEFALVGAGRGVTTLLGGISARAGVISDLSFENGLTYNSAATSGTALEMDRVAITIGDPYAQHGMALNDNSLVMTDSIITSSSANKDVPSHLFECGNANCPSITLMRTQVSVSGQFPNDGFDSNAAFFYSTGNSEVDAHLDIVDSTINVPGQGSVLFTSLEGSQIVLNVDDSYLAGGTGAIATFDTEGPLTISNSTVNGSIFWWDQGAPVTITGSTIVGELGEGFDENLGQNPNVPVTISDSTISSMRMTLALMTIKQTIVNGVVDLASSKATIASSQVASVLVEPADIGAASSATCTRVFDAKQKLLPSTCIPATN